MFFLLLQLLLCAFRTLPLFKSFQKGNKALLSVFESVLLRVGCIFCYTFSCVFSFRSYKTQMQPVKKVQLAASDVKLLAMKGFTIGDALNR